MCKCLSGRTTLPIISTLTNTKLITNLLIYMAIRINSMVIVPALYSITEERTEVIIISISTDKYTCQVRYPNGYIETLPVGILII